MNKLYIFLVPTVLVWPDCQLGLCADRTVAPRTPTLLALPPGKAVEEEDQSANEVGTGWVRQVWVVTDGSAPQRARGAAGTRAWTCELAVNTFTYHTRTDTQTDTRCSTTLQLIAETVWVSGVQKRKEVWTRRCFAVLLTHWRVVAVSGVQKWLAGFKDR